MNKPSLEVIRQSYFVDPIDGPTYENVVAVDIPSGLVRSMEEYVEKRSSDCLDVEDFIRTAIRAKLGC
jgi:hypothetical protein